MNFILRAVYIFLIKKILGGFLYIPKQLHFVKNYFFIFIICGGLAPPLCVLTQHPQFFYWYKAQPAYGERLHLCFNLINYITCKTILVLFSTNFILALSRSVPTKSTCGVGSNFDAVRPWSAAGKS